MLRDQAHQGMSATSHGTCCIHTAALYMQAATGEAVSAEELGGAELHCTTSGQHT